MNLLLSLAVSIGALALALPPEKAKAPGEDMPIRATLCEIKAHPEQFQHKLVQFTAVASHGFEDSMVESADCVWTVADNPGVWLEYGGTAKTDTMYCCGPTVGTRRSQPLRIDGMDVPLVENDAFGELNARLHPARPARRGSDLVRATMQGRIFARQEALNGRKFWAGYGHMGCCMLFVLTRVVDVDPAVLDPRKFEFLPPPPPPASPGKQQ